jgi:splicing factor 45
LNTASAPRPSHSATTSAAPTASKSTIADWTGDDDDINGFYTAEKRQRGGRKKRKKNNQQEERVMLDWDDVYDPSRPNIYDDYKHSEEKYREIREWKDRLYAHRFVKEKEYSDEMSEGSEDPPARNSKNILEVVRHQVLISHPRSICTTLRLLLCSTNDTQ